jgi:hypothetical protein
MPAARAQRLTQLFQELAKVYTKEAKELGEKERKMWDVPVVVEEEEEVIVVEESKEERGREESIKL